MAQRLLMAGLILVVLTLAALAAARLMFPTHWRVVAAEQILLSPWLDTGHLGEGGPAEELLLCYTKGLAIDASGNLLISDRGRGHRGRVVWRIDGDGIARVVAGAGIAGDATESLAAQMRLNRPEGLAVASDGSIFVSDGYNHAVYRVGTDGRAERVAGTGTQGHSGDGGKATEAQLNRPGEIRLDSAGNLLIAGVQSHRIRMVDPAGRITTVAGTGEQGFSPDGTPATQAKLDTPWAIGLDRQNRVLIAESANHIVRRIEEDGTLVTVAGTGVQGYSGDGGPATEAELNYPEALFVDAQGRLFIADAWNNVVRVVGADGTIATVAGTGNPGRASNGAMAAASPLDDPGNVLADANGFIFTDGDNGRVMRVLNDGTIHLLAGRGETESCTSLW